MADENQGAVNGDDQKVVNVDTETSNNQSGDGLDAVNAEAEKLKQELVSRDKKISELQKIAERLKSLESEKQADELAKKSAEEKVLHFQKEVDDMKRERVITRMLSGTDVSYSDACNILNGSSVEDQMKALNEVLNKVSSAKVEEEIASFKANTISSVDKTKPEATEHNDDAFFQRMKEAALQ